MFIKLLKGPKECRKWCRCKKTGRRKIYRHGKEARSMEHLECSMDMESRKQEYYRARGAAKRATFKAKNAERKKFYENLDGEDGKGRMCLG